MYKIFTWWTTKNRGLRKNDVTVMHRKELCWVERPWHVRGIQRKRFWIDDVDVHIKFEYEVGLAKVLPPRGFWVVWISGWNESQMTWNYVKEAQFLIRCHEFGRWQSEWKSRRWKQFFNPYIHSFFAPVVSPLGWSRTPAVVPAKIRCTSIPGTLRYCFLTDDPLRSCCLISSR